MVDTTLTEKKITREQYYDLEMVLALASEYRKKLDVLTDLALRITGERDPDGFYNQTGYTADAVSQGYNAETLMTFLGLSVDGDKGNGKYDMNASNRRMVKRELKREQAKFELTRR